jgi:hypothetical protein
VERRIKGRKTARQITVDREKLLARVEQLLPRVHARLEEDFRRTYVAPLNAISPANLETFLRKSAERLALRRAREGDVAPALKILAKLTGNPEFAEIPTVSQIPSRKGSRKDYARDKPREARRVVANAIRRIRQILAEETGEAVPRDLTVEVAAAILEREPAEIRRIIDSGI